MTTNWRVVFARVRSALVRRGRSTSDAEDLVQEAWVRLAQYQIGQSVSQPEAFLMRTALNLSIDLHRTRQAHGDEVDVDDVVLVDVGPGIEATLLARERVARMSVCIGRLSVRTREVFLAHRVEGLSYQEIAQRHQLSVSTIEKHVAKALLLIATGMEGW